MKDYRILLGLTFRNRLAGLRLGSWRKDNGKIDGQRIAVTAVIALSLLFTAGFMIFVEVKLFAALKMVKQAVLLPALAVLLCMVSTLFLSFFHVLSGLYFSRDTAWMAYLPVKSRTVMAAKMTEIWLGETAFCAAVLLPVFILYGGYLNAGAGYYIRMLFVTLLTPVLPLTVSMVLTSLLARATSLMRHKEAWIYGGSVLLLAGILYLETSVLPQIPQDAGMMFMVSLLLQREGLLNMLVGSFPPVLWAVHGISGNISEFLLFVGTCMGLGLGGLALLGNGYLMLCTRQSEQGTRKRRTCAGGVRWRQRSPLAALFRREFSEIVKTPAYAFNCLTMVIIFPLMVVMMSVGISSQISMDVLHGEVLQLLGGFAQTDILLMLAAALSFAALINPAIATAVSREGGRLPISRMLPVSARTQLRAKLAMGMTLDGLSLLVGVMTLVVLLPEYTLVAALAAVPALMLSYAICAVSLTVDAVRPNLHWTSETQVIKQSTNVLFGMLISMVLVLLPVIPVVLLDAGALVRLVAVMAVLLMECGAGYLLLHHVAEKRYAALEDSNT